MSWGDNKRICKGIVILFVCILLGIAVAEQQVNELTEYHDFVQACNIRYNSDQSYSLYLLGYRYTFNPPCTIADIAELAKRTQHKLMSEELQKYIIAGQLRLSSVMRVCVEKAFVFKKRLNECWQDFSYQIENY